MKRRTLLPALFVFALAAGNTAFAQGDGDEGARAKAMRQAERDKRELERRGRNAPPQARPQEQRRGDMQARQPEHWRGDNNQGRQPERWRGNNYQERHSWEQAQRARGVREWRGAGPDHGFYRGDRLPYEYRHRNYVVSDWRRHRLSAPPQGYYWVQSGSDYLLVAIATGIILQVLLGD